MSLFWWSLLSGFLAQIALGTAEAYMILGAEYGKEDGTCPRCRKG